MSYVAKLSFDYLETLFRQIFPKTKNPTAVWAPGRVNLLGEHTDYNAGFVFPMAIDAGIAMVGALNHTATVNLYSVDFQTKTRFSLKKIVPTQRLRWTNYVRGVCDQFLQAGYELGGMDVVLWGDVPQGAGLSSSAALEVATALLIDALNGCNIDRVKLVKMAQRAENEFVGVASGIMDQFASMMGEEDRALFLDCRTLDYELIPTPFKEQGYAVVVINSGVKRGLVGSEYNIRRLQCEEAVQLLRADLPTITALRDVTLDHLPLVEALPPVLAQRARHVVTENNRVLTAVEALKQGKLEDFGLLLNASHQSLQHDFEVSCPELDLLVKLAQDFPNTLGSRMTGAGFGGCTISLVPQASLPLFQEQILKQYERKTNISPEVYVFKASPGAQIIAKELPQS